jgi:hypothetical protein
MDSYVCPHNHLYWRSPVPQRSIPGELLLTTEDFSDDQVDEHTREALQGS